MHNPEQTPCQGLVDYMTGEMTDVERKRFERHLESCAACREDAAEWRLVWDRLAEETPQISLPEDLKDEVMGAIFAKEEAPRDAVNETAQPLERKRGHRCWRRGFLAAAIAAAFGLGFSAQTWLGDRGLQAESPAMGAEPTHIEQLMSLEPAAGEVVYGGKHAYGVACVLRSDQERRLVVYLFGTPRTVGQEAYQVWLLKDGDRRSAGTFRVDDSGIGVLTVPWPESSPPFDAVGITLEPDASSEAPRGAKMFKSV